MTETTNTLITSPTGADAGLGWIGKSVGRSEDSRLTTGRGRYLEDLPAAGMLFATVVRSTEAHAHITVQVDDARQVEGVAAVYTAAELGPANEGLPIIWISEGLRIPPYRPLADGVVHYVGQPIALVVAISRAIAEDCAEMVEVDYESLPVVVDPFAALEPDAPVLHPELGTNEAFAFELRTGDPDAAFADAHTIVSDTFSVQRQCALPMERRGVLVNYDPLTDQMTIWATVQHPHLYRGHLADALRLPHESVRVIVPDLGGAFGAYYEVYPEDVAVAFAARQLGAPVRWIEHRNESLLGTVHAREQHHEASMAFDEDGRILALRTRMTTDIGAYVDYSGIGPSYYTANFLTGPYDMQTVDITLRCAFTNKVRNGAYRGFGQPEATFVLERLVDLGADALGIDPVELRSRNLIAADAFPYRLASGAEMDSGNYQGLLDIACEHLDYHNLKARLSEERGDGKAIGLGIALYTEATGSSPSKTLAKRGYNVGGWEHVSVRIERDGAVTAFSSASHLGQGIRTALAQVCAERLGVEPGAVRVITGDTALVPLGNRGGVGSRCAVIAGQAMNEASTQLSTVIRQAAASMLEAAVEDVVLRDGHAEVNGSPASAIPFADIAELAYRQWGTDPMPITLSANATWDPPVVSFAAGLNAAVVSVDKRTGMIDIERFLIVHDCGTVINPAIVDGQIFGGTAQGIAGAIYEELIYDDDGQLRSGTLMDYLVPSSMEIPEFEIYHQETPAPHHPLGVKGCGEAGTVAPAAALANAVADALQTAKANRLPLKPEVVWQMAQS